MRPHLLQSASLHGRPTDRLVRRLLLKPGTRTRTRRSVGRWREVPSRRRVKERRGGSRVVRDHHHRDEDDGVRARVEGCAASRAVRRARSERRPRRRARNGSIAVGLLDHREGMEGAPRRREEGLARQGRSRQGARAAGFVLSSFVRSFVRSFGRLFLLGLRPTSVVCARGGEGRREREAHTRTARVVATRGFRHRETSEDPPDDDACAGRAPHRGGRRWGVRTIGVHARTHRRTIGVSAQTTAERSVSAQTTAERSVSTHSPPNDRCPRKPPPTGPPRARVRRTRA